MVSGQIERVIENSRISLDPNPEKRDTARVIKHLTNHVDVHRLAPRTEQNQHLELSKRTRIFVHAYPYRLKALPMRSEDKR